MMTPEERLEACEQALAALQARIDALSKHVDGIGDYAGQTRYFANQLQISTDARLKHLEDKDEAKTE